MNSVFHIARKEFAGFFASPIAFIFFGVFLAVTLFVVFWVETFFARNIADVRPMFEWMPLLLLFLTAAISMRMWSEERRLGTLELLLTSPVAPWQFVAGKFLACLGLVATALLLTLPLPASISLLGNLDWGPVLGGYLATLFLAAAYIAIGLFISARSDNQIISLILTVVICAVFYLIGADSFTALFGNQGSEFLKLLGSGSRFDAITRGVIDLRDLYYYLSLAAVFLVLNVFALEMLRWAGNRPNPNHRRWGALTALLVANFLLANVWLHSVNQARIDFTDGKLYSISDATRSYLHQLQEPLLIRGYFSAQTHPLLAPLVPRLRDLLKEYALAGEGRVRLEFIDPLENPELEKEAGEKYQIQPVAFQTASKYQAAVVNSYFDILVQYGDQHEKLGFRDLIEIKVRSETDIDVDLRNPEYDITRSIKKVLLAYQGEGQLFDNIAQPVTFHGYISPDASLPQPLVDLRRGLDSLLAELELESNGKFSVDIRDPDDEGGALARQIREEYGFRPMAAGLFDPNSFWFYMTLESGDQMVQVPLPEGFSPTALEQGLNAALKRFSGGFLKTVALHSPDPTPTMTRSGQMQFGGKRFTLLEDSLAEGHSAIQAKLTDGSAPDTADLLMLVAPDQLDEKQLFALDQFLMRGGTLILASSPFDIETTGQLSAKTHSSGLEEWLKHHGITMEPTMVLDPQNSAFPIPVQRNLGGFMVSETQMVEYPFFVDVRESGLNRDSGITAGIDQVTINWPSPIIIDQERNQGRNITPILESTEAAWTSDSTHIQPDFTRYGPLGFPQGEDAGRKLLAVAVEGRFESFFKDRPSPLARSPEDENSADDAPASINRVIDRSPDAARIILFASNTFLNDEILDLATSGMGTLYLKPVQLVTNAVDWSLEDRQLLGIRGRGHFSRILMPLDRDAQVFWEYLNYALALCGLLGVWLVRRYRIRLNLTRQRALLNMGEA